MESPIRKSWTVVESRTEPMNCRITPRPAGPGDRTLLRAEVAGDDAQQGGLAGAVRAHQGGLGSVTDPEVDVGQQHSAIRELVRHGLDIDITHAA